MQITDGNFKQKKFYKPSTELSDCIKLDPDNCLDRPPVTVRDKNIGCGEAALSRASYNDEPSCDGISGSNQHSDNVTGIQVLWQEHPYCPPVGIGKATQNNRTVGCQVEVDVGNQTRIQNFKEIKWEEILKLEPQPNPYRVKLTKILEKHRPAFAADLTEIAIMEDVYYRIDLRADATPVNRRAFRMLPVNEAEPER